MNMILKECEEKNGCKGRGYVREILSPMKNFKDQQWSLSWKVQRPTYFKKDMMEMHIEHN